MGAIKDADCIVTPGLDRAANVPWVPTAGVDDGGNVNAGMD